MARHGALNRGRSKHAKMFANSPLEPSRLAKAKAKDLPEEIAQS
jgi:hypothetical protein